MSLTTPRPNVLRPLPFTITSTVLLGLLMVLYGPLLWHWVDGWLNKSISIQHEYFSHGLLGLPFAAYLAWSYRHQWRNLPETLHPVGLGLLGLGAVFYMSQLPDWINISFPLVLAGLCLSLKGLPGLQMMGFPLLLVILATPSQLPYLIEPYIVPLQRFIASVAGFILLQGGIDVTVNQIYLSVNDQMVEVAPHCAGLKILFTSLYVSLMLIYWTELWRSRLRTWTFLTATIALSVSGNIIRNALLSYFHGVSYRDAFYWLHDSWGGDVYSAIMLMFLIVIVRLIQRYLPERVTLTVDSVSSV